ncbi:MAG: hypothetical protein WCH99_01205 [Verrucomicrobiota bacterium]
MNNWRVIFSTVVIFGAGVVTGGLLVNYVHHPHLKPLRAKAAAADAHSTATNPPARPAANAKLRPPELLSKQFLQQLDEVLHLNQEQREAIQKIISERQGQIRRVVQDSRREIREVLTADQHRPFDELLKQQTQPRRPGSGTNSPAWLLTNAPAVSTNTP